MADAADWAKSMEDKSREHAIKKALSNKEQANVVDGETLCLECGEVVPAQRVENVNAVRCIECQTLLEIKQKQLGG